MSISVLDAAHVTVCYGVKWSYTCPPGSVISITSAQYGRSFDYVCGYREDCIDSHSAFTALQEQCNTTNTCHITASHNQFGTSQCYNKSNYLNFTFQCIPGNTFHYTSVDINSITKLGNNSYNLYSPLAILMLHLTFIVPYWIFSSNSLYT